MKRITLFLVLIAAASLFAGCAGQDEIEIENLNGEPVIINTADLTDAQKELMNELSDGEITLSDLVMSGEFTIEELDEYGLSAHMDKAGNNDMRGSMMNDFDLSKVDIDSLTLENVSDETADAILDAIEEGKTMQEIIDEGEVTMEEIMNSGLIQNKGQNMPFGGQGGQKPIKGNEG